MPAVSQAQCPSPGAAAPHLDSRGGSLCVQRPAERGHAGGWQRAGTAAPGHRSWRSRPAGAAARLPRPGAYGPGMDSLPTAFSFRRPGLYGWKEDAGERGASGPARSRGRFTGKAVRAGEGRAFGDGLPDGVPAGEGRARSHLTLKRIPFRSAPGGAREGRRWTHGTPTAARPDRSRTAGRGGPICFPAPSGCPVPAAGFESAAARRARTAPAGAPDGLLAPRLGQSRARAGGRSGSCPEKPDEATGYTWIRAVRTCVPRSRVARDNGIYRE